MKKQVAAIFFSLFSLLIYAEETANFTEGTKTVEDTNAVRKPVMMVVGIECRTSNAQNAAPLDIPRLWEKFFKEGIVHKIPNKASDEIVALYCDYEGDYTKPYSVVIGCPVGSLDEIPEGMVGKVVPASSFAVFKPTGEYPKSLIDVWMRVWSSHLKRTYSGDYELYGKGFASSDSGDLQVFIAIEK